jgi:hypothetical protein
MTSRRLNAHRWPVDWALRGEASARDRFGPKAAAPSPTARRIAPDDEQERSARLLVLDEKGNLASLDASPATGLDECERSGADSPLSREDIVARLRALRDVRAGVGVEAKFVERRHGRWGMGSGSRGRGCRRGRLWPCQSCARATEQSRGVLLWVTHKATRVQNGYVARARAATRVHC